MSVHRVRWAAASVALLAAGFDNQGPSNTGDGKTRSPQDQARIDADRARRAPALKAAAEAKRARRRARNLKTSGEL